METHFQRIHLSSCADFAGNDLQNYKFKGQNGQNHQANRDITLHVFWLTFYCYILICPGSTMFESKGWRKGLWAPLLSGVSSTSHLNLHIIIV